jgi:hypothetical protein
MVLAKLRRIFPGILDNAKARYWARVIAGWKPLPPGHRRSRYAAPGSNQADATRTHPLLAWIVMRDQPEYSGEFVAPLVTR